MKFCLGWAERVLSTATPPPAGGAGLPHAVATRSPSTSLASHVLQHRGDIDHLINSVTPDIPLTLYVHIPWCVQKCPYCDFNSHALRETAPETQYVDALLKDLDHDLKHLSKFIASRKLSAIFIGGGTPSLFSGEAIDRLLNGINDRTELKSGIEITLEANPGTVEQSRFIDYVKAGVNRLSIGIQSFSPEQLKKLGRIHDRNEAFKAVDAGRNAGFKNINIDLMFGLPNQTVEEALTDLQTGIGLGTEHLSWYELTLEPNTPFYRQPPPIPEDETKITMFERGIELLSGSGFERYEVSAYARPGYECHHNLNYWLYGDYLAIGAGAHGKLTNIETGEIIRSWKKRHPKMYLSGMGDGIFIEGQERLSDEARIQEFMMNVLRLMQPISFELFETRTGLLRNRLDAGMQRGLELGWMKVDSGQFMLTESGRWLLNEAVMLF